MSPSSLVPRPCGSGLGTRLVPQSMYIVHVDGNNHCKHYTVPILAVLVWLIRLLLKICVNETHGRQYVHLNHILTMRQLKLVTLRWSNIGTLC